ncbi:hypothetical protein K501DRAFT_220543 [Backusella circina FSU 941]|nr:hypothetical protein K501DRAFT_220543 [Backusella circina FSU 941]
MGLEKDTLHVVIRLPFKRPKGFIEPPSIVWTDEMDHKLWQYMSQKNTDWNYIAEQLGVPTSYLVRHAAFIYETQLRGIQQQLRLNGSRNTKSPVQTTSSSSRPTSVRYSNTPQQQEEQQPRRNRDESMILSNLSNISPRIPEKEIGSSHSSYKQEVPLNNTVYKSVSSQHSREEELEESDSAQEEEEETEEQGSGELETRIREIGGESETEDEEQDDSEELKDEEEGSKEEDEEEEFSSHFERMKLQMEEPAFLPRKLDSSRQLSVSMQQLKREHTPPTQRSPAVQPVTPSSALNSVGSSFSDLSDSSITQSALEDAYMSKFNQGSKMSIFNLSRKYN